MRSLGLAHHQPTHRNERPHCSKPEYEHPADHISLGSSKIGAILGLEPADLRAKFTPELADLRAKLGPEFGQSLLQLGIKPGEVQLVQLPEIGTVGGVHLIEPVAST